MAQPMSRGNIGRDVWSDLVHLTQIAKLDNKFWELFPKESYQINPYTKRSVSFVTGKVGERRPVTAVELIPDYDRIKCLLDKAVTLPKEKCYISKPQTELQRLGWFPQTMDPESNDKRFVHHHQTSEFLKVQSQIKAHDRLMSGLSLSKVK